MRLLDREDSVLLVIDAQERFYGPERDDVDRERLHLSFERAGWLTAAAAALGVPVVVTEEAADQNGPTDPRVARHLPGATPVFDKRYFGAPDNPEIMAALDGTYVSLGYLPVEEASTNPMMKNFVKYVGTDNIDQFAYYAWASTIAFADAAKAVVAKSGVNGLTRKAFLADGIPTLTKFDAGGMIGVTNVTDRIPSGCFLMMQIKDAKYVRQYPAKKGTFDCNPKNAISIKADYIDNN